MDSGGGPNGDGDRGRTGMRGVADGGRRPGHGHVRGIHTGTERYRRPTRRTDTGHVREVAKNYVRGHVETAVPVRDAGRGGRQHGLRARRVRVPGDDHGTAHGRGQRGPGDRRRAHGMRDVVAGTGTHRVRDRPCRRRRYRDGTGESRVRPFAGQVREQHRDGVHGRRRTGRGPNVRGHRIRRYRGAGARQALHVRGGGDVGREHRRRRRRRAHRLRREERHVHGVPVAGSRIALESHGDRDRPGPD